MSRDGLKKKTARTKGVRAVRETVYLGSTTWLPQEQVGTQQAEGLQASLGNTPALLLPFANRRGLDVEKASDCRRSTQFFDERLTVHSPSIGGPMALSIGSPILFFSRLT